MSKPNGCYCLGVPHEWREEYYGYRCIDCDLFIPYGCEPWIDASEDSEDEEPETLWECKP